MKRAALMDMSSPMRCGPPPPPRGGGGGGYNSFGLLIPAPVAWLIALLLCLSAVGSLLERMGVPILTYSLLTPPQVWKGEIWRLVTWAPLELRPRSLLFGCVAMYFFCPD